MPVKTKTQSAGGPASLHCCRYPLEPSLVPLVDNPHFKEIVKETWPRECLNHNFKCTYERHYLLPASLHVNTLLQGLITLHFCSPFAFDCQSPSHSFWDQPCGISFPISFIFLILYCIYSTPQTSPVLEDNHIRSFILESSWSLFCLVFYCSDEMHCLFYSLLLDVGYFSSFFRFLITLPFST